MGEIRADSVLMRHPEAAYRTIDGQALIVLPRDAKMLTLNAVGTRVWELLGERTVAEIAAAIVEEFDVSFEEAMTDTVEFLGQLDERGMVVGD